MRNKYKFLTVNKRHIAEHRYVMEQHLGRELITEEIIHHINHDSYDNRIENLRLVTKEEHIKIHREEKKLYPIIKMKKREEVKQLVTSREAAKMLKVSSQTIRRWDEIGKLNSIRFVPTGYRYYRIKDLEKLLNK